jgi:hypothetical protein
VDTDGIIEGLKRLNVPHERIAQVIKRDRTAATKMLLGRRSVKANEIEPLRGLLAEYEEAHGESAMVRRARALEDEFSAGLVSDYVGVEVLPTFAGMGGGGSGEGDRELALLPRRLVEDELRAKPSDLLVINVRGTSMEPVFFQDDQLLVDRRDKDTLQPGPFAIRYVDDEGYQVKNVERVPRTTRLRVFSTNPIFGDREEDEENIEIVGRPVWFARRL